MAKEVKPPLKIEVETSSKNPGTTEGRQLVFVKDMSEYVDRLRHECCSRCQPHPSQLSDDEYKYYAAMGHMPWDEVEMRKHALLDGKCRHVEATAQRSEASEAIRSEAANRVGTASKLGRSIPRFVLEQATLSSEESEEETDSSTQSPWERIEEAPMSPYFVDYSNSVATVEELMDGGRLIFVRSDEKCELLILENPRGERVYVGANCCGCRGDGKSRDSQPASLLSIGGGPSKEPEPAIASDSVTSGRKPTLVLMSHDGQLEETPKSAEGPPTLQSGSRKPLAVESFVENSEGPAEKRRIVELPVSSVVQESARSYRSVTEAQMSDPKVKMRVCVNINVCRKEQKPRNR